MEKTNKVKESLLWLSNNRHCEPRRGEACLAGRQAISLFGIASVPLRFRSRSLAMTIIGQPLLYRYNSKYKEILHNLIRRNLKRKVQYNILDIGCGKGDDLVRVSLLGGNIRVYGVDADSASLESAFKKIEGSVNSSILQADAERLPFKGSCFDIIFSSEVLEHLVGVEDFVKSVRNILKDRGVFILTTPSRYNYVSLVGKIIPRPFKSFFRKSVYYLNPGGKKNPHIREYTPGEVKNLLETNGFLVEDIESGVLRVPIWPLFDKFSFLVFIWSCLDKFADLVPFAMHLKLNFIIAARKIQFNEQNLIN